MKQIFQFIIITFFLWMVVSCKKLVEAPPPTTQIVTATVFNNAATATQAVLNIYAGSAGMIGYPYTLAFPLGKLSDEFDNYSTGADQVQLYTNAMLPSYSLGPWSYAYYYIYQANAILEGLQRFQGVEDKIKQQLIGEAKFVRGFWYFYLVNCYGDVPLAISTDYETNSRLSRSSKDLIYQQIVSDLKDAKNTLNSNYVDATDTSLTTERIRPTSWAAKAMLARVYLYTGKYDLAETESTDIINNTGVFSLVSDLNGVFLANSAEAIWQIQIPLPNGAATRDGASYILTAKPSAGKTTISQPLLNSFETNDARKDNWISSITKGTPAVTYYFPFKYKIRQSLNPNDPKGEYVMVLRLAEQYLVRAEARAQQNKLSEAADDLNVIRNRAGLSNTTAATQQDLLTAILHERQVELFTEWGHRWFDLIRSANVNELMSAITAQKGGTWDASGYQKLFPIPQSERLLNLNLTQNPGYTN